MIRIATADDLPDIERVMRASTASLSAGFYDDAQIASAVEVAEGWLDPATDAARAPEATGGLRTSEPSCQVKRQL